MRLSRIVFLALALTLLANCGVKGPPLPPESANPQKLKEDPDEKERKRKSR